MDTPIPSWDEYFMHLAEETALRSKDPNTKVGACFVKDKRVLSLGYNGAPRNFPDNLVPASSDSSLPLKHNKNTYMVHAELNAILNFRGNLSELEGSTLYVTVSPCYECAKMLSQLKVKEIIFKREYHRNEHIQISKFIFDTCGIKIKKFEN